MEETFINRQDIYYIVVPIIITVLTWLLSLFKTNENKFTRKWRCSKNKSSCEVYEKYLLTILPLGIFFLLISTIFMSFLNLIFIYTFEEGLSNNYLTSVVAFTSALCNVIYILFKKIKWAHFTITIACLKKYKKMIIYFLYFCPILCNIWICGFSLLFEHNEVDFILMFVLITCELLSIVLLDTKRYDQYSCVKLSFKNDSTIDTHVKYVNQQGNWIIIQEPDNMSESRYREDNLVSVTYSNDNDINNPDDSIEISLWNYITNWFKHCIQVKKTRKIKSNTNTIIVRRDINCTEKIIEEKNHINYLSKLKIWFLDRPVISAILGLAAYWVIMNCLCYILVLIKTHLSITPLSERTLLSLTDEITGASILEILFGFLPEHCYFVTANSLTIAGLLIASIGELRSDDQDIIDHVYNTKPTYISEDKNGTNRAVNIPSQAIKKAITAKCNLISGLIFTAIGTILSTFANTQKPPENAVLSTLLMIILSLCLCAIFAKLTCKFRAQDIKKKLLSGNIRPSSGLMFIKKE
jgi:hypothetical protein